MFRNKNKKRKMVRSGKVEKFMLTYSYKKEKCEICYTTQKELLEKYNEISNSKLLICHSKLQ